MEENNRRLVVVIVLIGVFASITAGGVLVVTRELGITQDKALYFREEYSSEFEVFYKDRDTPKELIFESEETKDEDEWKAVIEYKDKDYDDVEVSKDGYILKSDGDESDKYFFLWWEEEDLKITANTNGFGRAIISEEEEKQIKDPYGIFLHENDTYIAVCKESLVYLRGRFATQASFRYIIKRKNDDRVVGDAIIDMTSGLPFEMNLYEQNKSSVRILLKDTTFIISRNRYRLLTAASIILPLTFVGLYFILKKYKCAESEEEIKDCLFLGGMGLFAFWLDQFFDFWYTYTILMPVVIAMHCVPIVLILVFKRELWHFIFIPILELAVYGMFIFFNMGIYVLWLFYGSVVLWFALAAHFHYVDGREQSPT